jgi:hypothetical protein
MHDRILTVTPAEETKETLEDSILLKNVTR